MQTRKKKKNINDLPWSSPFGILVEAQPALSHHRFIRRDMLWWIVITSWAWSMVWCLADDIGNRSSEGFFHSLQRARGRKTRPTDGFFSIYLKILKKRISEQKILKVFVCFCFPIALHWISGDDLRNDKLTPRMFGKSCRQNILILVFIAFHWISGVCVCVCEEFAVFTTQPFSCPNKSTRISCRPDSHF